MGERKRAGPVRKEDNCRVPAVIARSPLPRPQIGRQGVTYCRQGVRNLSPKEIPIRQDRLFYTQFNAFNLR